MKPVKEPKKSKFYNWEEQRWRVDFQSLGSQALMNISTFPLSVSGSDFFGQTSSNFYSTSCL